MKLVEYLILALWLVLTCQTTRAADKSDTAKFAQKPVPPGVSTSQPDPRPKTLKFNTISRMYGGEQLVPAPDILTVTEEIWFDLKIPHYYGKGGHFRRRVTIVCFGELAPSSCVHFALLAKGYKYAKKHFRYTGTKVDKIQRDFMIQLGDIRSLYPASSDITVFGSDVRDKNSVLSHNHAGWVGLVNFGHHPSGSQFYVMLRRARWLDGKHVLFGKVKTGMDAIVAISREETREGGIPLRPVLIENCGVLGLKKPYKLTARQVNTDGDIHVPRH